MTSGPRSLTPLLVAARHDRRDLRLTDFSTEQIRWAVSAGLGPWLRRCTADDPRAGESPAWPLVQSADLTARVLADEKRDAMEEILGHVARHVPPLTLLKGISLCEQHYPEPHLRTMGDIDVLVDEASVPELESRLIELGYRPQSAYPPEFYESHHHAVPLFIPVGGCGSRSIAGSSRPAARRARRQRTLGRTSLGALHALLDRYVVAGRPFDRVVSARTFGILWETLLSPGRPSGNTLRAGWRLLPSLGWFRRQVRLEVRRTR